MVKISETLGPLGRAVSRSLLPGRAPRFGAACRPTAIAMRQHRPSRRRAGARFSAAGCHGMRFRSRANRDSLPNFPCDASGQGVVAFRVNLRHVGTCVA